jgi:DNA-binding response OmpR family regulator
VLFSRVGAVLRRGVSTEKASSIIKFGSFVMEPEKFAIRKGNNSVTLTLSEYGILRRLVSNRGKVLTRNQLLDDVQNEEAFIIDRNIDVHVASLRKKLGPNFEWIETVRGVGYRFKED